VWELQDDPRSSPGVVRKPGKQRGRSPICYRGYRRARNLHGEVCSDVPPRRGERVAVSGDVASDIDDGHGDGDGIAITATPATATTVAATAASAAHHGARRQQPDGLVLEHWCSPT
jgi:hypothetical protein